MESKSNNNGACRGQGLLKPVNARLESDYPEQWRRECSYPSPFLCYLLRGGLRSKTLVLAALLCGSALAATPSFTLSLYGPGNTYAGYGSSWAIVTVSTATPYSGHVYFEPVTPPAGITMIPVCGASQGTYNLGSVGCYPDAASKRLYQWGLLTPAPAGFSVTYKITAASAVSPGTYNVSAGITIGTNGHWVTNSTSIPVRVVTVPAKSADTPRISLPIPGLAKWERSMTKLGATWCTKASPTTFLYNNTGESLMGARSIWYYDGGRVYLQIADYTHDPKWNDCATWILDDYAAHILGAAPNGYGVPLGNEVFARGLFLGWQRTGNVKYTQALSYLMAHSPYSPSGGILLVPHSGGDSRDPGLRETALMGSLYLCALQAGIIAADSPEASRIQRNAEWLLLYFDQTFSRNNPMAFDQPFYDGIAAEFLIRWYEFSGDPRIPAAIKSMLDFHWQNTVNHTTGAVQYSTFQADEHSKSGVVVPLCSAYDGGCPTKTDRNYVTDVTNLLAPAFAWYWNITGDETYRTRGDFLFSHAVVPDDKGKVFSQNYYWSTDYVRWRSVTTRVVRK